MRMTTFFGLCLAILFGFGVEYGLKLKGWDYLPAPLTIGLLALFFLAWFRETDNAVNITEYQSIRREVFFRAFIMKFFEHMVQLDYPQFQVIEAFSPDDQNNFQLRHQLRDAALTSVEGYEELAAGLIKGEKQPAETYELFRRLVIATKTMGLVFDDYVIQHLINVAKIWKIGPNQITHLFVEQGLETNLLDILLEPIRGSKKKSRIPFNMGVMLE